MLTGVGHAYEQNHPVLSAVDLRIAPGEVVAVVGATGAGKSTLAQIVAGTVPPTDGTVRLGSTIVRDLPPDELRARISMVSQEVHVFSGSIAENVRVPRPEAPDDDVLAALTAVGAHCWMRTLPEGVETVVGDGGHSLTAMQEQMLALARIVLADPEFVILDEATAEAGSSGARDLETAAGAVLTGRGGLVVAHRLSQAVTADRVLVMARGRSWNPEPMRSSAAETGSTRRSGRRGPRGEATRREASAPQPSPSRRSRCSDEVEVSSGSTRQDGRSGPHPDLHQEPS